MGWIAYFSSTALSCITVPLGLKAIEARFEREGYRWVNDGKTSISEKIEFCIKLGVLLFSPFVNFCVSVLILFGHEFLYQKVKEEGLKSGDMYNINMFKPIEEETGNEVEISTGKTLNTYTETMENISSEKKDDKIPEIEEYLAWLERKKDMLLNPNRHIVEEDSIDGHVTYQKNNTPKV